MNSSNFIPSYQIRAQFTAAMSAMYQDEVPQYGQLFTLVKSVNEKALGNDLETLSEEERNLLITEHHGAIRVGTAQELSTLRRLFKVMGMHAVDYYDLSVAGIPVHSTAFRSINPKELLISPFRVFTSLLRLDLITDENLRESAKKTLSQRNFFSDELIELIEIAENQGGLDSNQAPKFVYEALEIFRWHQQANVDKCEYEQLKAAHGLIADVVSFKGPHINHLTPKVLDIDALQAQFFEHGVKAKAVVEGPPRRACPILLRQTSFIALEEAIIFADGEQGTHTARFGEVEQRGIALTPKGRLLYDKLLNQARNKQAGCPDYQVNLKQVFNEFPDNYQEIREQELAYFRYSATSKPLTSETNSSSLKLLIENGNIEYSPITYEDFLPVSAAGIFTSNLAGNTSGNSKENAMEVPQSPNKESFEEALGAPVIDSFTLYEKIQSDSLTATFKSLGLTELM